MFNHLSEVNLPEHIAWADGPGWLGALLVAYVLLFVVMAVHEQRQRVSVKPVLARSSDEEVRHAA